MGASTARMVANAPVYGDRFSWHIDADPSAFPPSPWRDHFGTYTNRQEEVLLSFRRCTVLAGWCHCGTWEPWQNGPLSGPTPTAKTQGDLSVSLLYTRSWFVVCRTVAGPLRDLHQQVMTR